jgi:hypothetical protein
VRYDELTQMVKGSSPDDWEVLGSGPNYLDKFAEVTSGDQHWVELAWHDYLAVFKADVSLRLAWGMTVADELTFEDWHFPDKSGYRLLVDAFWQGALVARWTILGVDGGRAYLPDVRQEYVKTGESITDYENVAYSAKASEIALARLLDRIVRGQSSEFDRCFEQAGIVEVPG